MKQLELNYQTVREHERPQLFWMLLTAYVLSISFLLYIMISIESMDSILGVTISVITLFVITFASGIILDNHNKNWEKNYFKPFYESLPTFEVTTFSIEEGINNLNLPTNKVKFKHTDGSTHYVTVAKKHYVKDAETSYLEYKWLEENLGTSYCKGVHDVNLYIAIK